MRLIQSMILISLTIISTSCSSTNIFTQGSVSPENFHSSISFTTAKSLIIIPVELNGVQKNFIFDTGAEVTAIQRDTLVGEIISVRGGSNRVIESGSETVKSIKIGEVDFINTFATNGNEAYLKENIPNYGGTLGRTVFDKSNWLINYPSRTIELSNKELADDSFSDIPLLPSSSTPYTMIEINDKEYRAIIDLGSTSFFNVPVDTELANELLTNYTFTEHTRERYTVGGVQTITELKGIVPILTIGNNIFENVIVNINESSQIRLGMNFFTDYLIYIDNLNHKFRFKLPD